ncbi:MAG: hypothetical protein U0166_07335 [Acidobacteriota bacterium]
MDRTGTICRTPSGNAVLEALRADLEGRRPGGRFEPVERLDKAFVGGSILASCGR